ncbi:DUF1918 domain-containing protein [Halorussus pelagicus]|uniref:DUF1918 domain-containing protein n=1 Tax=Halorussus pelagicus TaxID=2505977 RepID=UPI000FFB092A|nr:DUF1918 domain-containing protein [Halorussus pelagicus]
MSFDEDDRVILHDEHSDYDGEEGQVTQVMDTMFGDSTYTVSFEDGQETGIPEDALEAAADEDADDEEDEA